MHLLIPQLVVDEMVEHARREAPNEGCGLLVGASREPTGFVPGVNTCPSPHHFVMAPETWLSAAQIGQVVGVMHSHPWDRAWPSEHDLGFAANPHLAKMVHVIVSLQLMDPVVRAFDLSGRTTRLLWSSEPTRVLAEDAHRDGEGDDLGGARRERIPATGGATV